MRQAVLPTETATTVSRRMLLAVVTTLALLAALAVQPAPTAWGSERWPTWIVPVESPLPSGAQILQALPVAGALVVSSPVAPLGAAAAATPLGWKQLDETATATALGEVRLDSGVSTIGAPQAWETTRGQDAVVALVDTGIAPVPAMDGAVAGEIDFSGTGGGDGYGHGTFIASLIAGRGSTAPGVAPEALLLSLKVADDDGATDLSQVLGALQWLHGPGQASGIRIAVLALGAEPDTKGAEFLDRATAALARRGVLVVTAAGNEGPGTLTSPATSTGTFSAGALGVLDQDGNVASYDEVAWFSGSGHDRRGVPQPDVLAPGVRIAGSLPPDSALARQALADNPDALIDGQWVHGTGTSVSTALAAGVAALIASARADFAGPELDAALRSGDGRLDAAASLDEALAAPPARPGNRAAPAPEPTSKAAGNGNGPAGSADPQGVRWVGSEPWDGVRWVGVRWVGVRWVGVRWVEDHWGDASWEEDTWGGVRWVGVRWVGVRWVGNGWAGEVPEDGAAEVGWAGVRWAGVRWAGVRWAGVRWALMPAR